jgi:methylmalonyl-CoA/ethylmalonyl-CoA epimerase
MKLNHIGIAVKSIEDQLKVWKNVLGLELIDVINVPDQKVVAAILSAGGVHVELLEALEEASTIHAFIDKRGEGLHHLCFGVEDIEQALRDMKTQDVRLIDEVPRIGASGKKIAFIHPKSTGGVLIELEEL